MEDASESERFKDFIASIGGVAVEWARLEAELHSFIGLLLFGDFVKGIELFIEINNETFLKIFARTYFPVVNIEECDIIFSDLYNRIKIAKTKRNGIVHAYWDFYSENSGHMMTKGDVNKEKHKKNKKIFTIDIELKEIDEIKTLVKDIVQIRTELDLFKENLISRGIIKIVKQNDDLTT